MKKTILVLCTTLILLSCSKKDETNPLDQELAVNYENMAGNWKLSSIILANGSIVPFQGQCATKKDYFIITVQNYLTEYHYYSDCLGDGFMSDTTNGYYFNGNLIKNAGGVFSDARITSLKVNSMKVQYDDVESFGYFSIYSEVKGAILTK